MEEIGIIEEIASGHEKDIKIFGITIFPKTYGWLGIRRFYDNSSVWNRLKYKQLGTYTTPNYKAYKVGDKVKVEIESKKIISIEKISHLSKIEEFYHFAPIIWFIVGILLLLVLSFFDIHITRP